MHLMHGVAARDWVVSAIRFAIFKGRGILPALYEKEHQMLNLLETIRTAARNRVAYSRTVAELSALSVRAQSDLGLHAGNIKQIARAAAYGPARTATAANPNRLPMPSMLNPVLA